MFTLFVAQLSSGPDVPVPAGLLYYSQLDSVLRVEAKQNEMRALILARNELAGYLVKQRQLQVTSDSQLSYDIEDSSFLPPTIDNPRECKTCYASDSCMLYRKAEQMGSTDDADPLADLFEEKTGHLSEKDMEFFRKWETLLTIEEQDIGRFRSQLWTMTAKERRKTGRWDDTVPCTLQWLTVSQVLQRYGHFCLLERSRTIPSQDSPSFVHLYQIVKRWT